VVPLNVAWAIQDVELAGEIQSCMRDLPVRMVFGKENFDAFFRQLRAVHADVVLVQAPGDALVREYIARIKALPEPPVVMIVGASVNAESILAAFRAGADEYLHPPFEKILRDAIIRESARRRDEVAQRGQILGFMSVKGGCGGTTVACGAALELARAEQGRALLLDLDCSAGIAGFLTGATGARTAADVIRNAAALDEDCWSGLVSEGPHGLHIVPAPKSFGGSCDLPIENVREALRFVRGHYAWTMCDLGSCLTRERLALCEEMDVLYLVTTVDITALYCCVQTVHALEESGLPKTGLRLLVRQAEALPEMTPPEMERALGLPVETVVPEDRPAIARWHAGERTALAPGKLGRALAQIVSGITGKPPAPAPPGPSLWRAALRALQPSRGNA
jgi:pilus assembly protein CpaE